MKEPSVLDIFKEKAQFWKKKSGPQQPLTGSSISSGAQSDDAVASAGMSTEPIPETKHGFRIGPWKTFAALLFALIAQALMEPPNPSIKGAVGLYLFAGFLAVAAILTREWDLPKNRTDSSHAFATSYRRIPFLVSVLLLMLSFFAFGGNRFTAINLTLWIAGLGFLLFSLWLPGTGEPWWKRLFLGNKKPIFTFKITAWTVLVILSLLAVTFYRFYRLNQVPGEMFSDHAEKLLDIGDILNGQYSVFFPRNTGREFVQMYLTAFIAAWLGQGLTFLSLKLGTAILGFFTLPFIYLVGKEVSNRQVGLAAMFLAGIAYWPNVISRIGLRFPLYPFFAAPALYFLIRGIRKQDRNLILLSGLAVGFGLHGYSPARFVPFVILAAFGLYLLHPISRGKRKQALITLAVLGGVAFAVFIPLFRYAVEDPTGFSIRAFSRLAGTESPLPGPAWQIFFSNTWKALIMFFYDNGEIWVHSIPHRPALDYVTGAFFFLGLIVVILRYIKRRNWVDLFLLISIPLLMMPSILSLAFPAENPSLNRTGAAIVPVFVIAAMGIMSALESMWRRIQGKFGRTMIILLGIILLIWTATLNFRLVFKTFDDQFMAGAWNTSEIGRVIRGFANSVGTDDTAFVVPFPYWVDTRLVGINAGFPQKDYALWPDNFKDTLAEKRAKLFILKAEDTEDLGKLQAMYPGGTTTTHKNPREGKDFFIFFVPAQAPAE
jgi:hypothetical protein